MNPKRIFEREREVLNGYAQSMTLANDLTYKLWHRFKSENKAELSVYQGKYYSVQSFPEKFTGGPHETFLKWAAITGETSNESMTSLHIPEGLYAEFEHIGTPDSFGNTMRNIFSVWLPKSGFQLDNRPHLSIMENNYSTTDPEAVEIILIPIKPL